jgi:hypothetical protein
MAEADPHVLFAGHARARGFLLTVVDIRHAGPSAEANRRAIA